MKEAYENRQFRQIRAAVVRAQEGKENEEKEKEEEENSSNRDVITDGLRCSHAISELYYFIF